MNDPIDGGPAFPVPNDANVNGQERMSLRDWFAGQALQGLLASEVSGEGLLKSLTKQQTESDDVTLEEVNADIAWGWADAMLLRRGL